MERITTQANEQFFQAAPRRKPFQVRAPNYQRVTDDRKAEGADPLHGVFPYNLAVRAIDTVDTTAHRMAITEAMTRSCAGRTIVLDAMTLMCERGWITKEQLEVICPAHDTHGVVRVTDRQPLSSERAIAEVDISSTIGVGESPPVVFNHPVVSSEVVKTQFQFVKGAPDPDPHANIVAAHHKESDPTLSSRASLPVEQITAPPGTGKRKCRKTFRVTPQRHSELNQKAPRDHPEEAFTSANSPNWSFETGVAEKYKTMARLAANHTALMEIKNHMSSVSEITPLAQIASITNEIDTNRDAFVTLQRHAVESIRIGVVMGHIAHDILMITYRNEGNLMEPTKEQFETKFIGVKTSPQIIRASFNRCQIWASDRGNIIYTLLLGAILTGRLQLRSLIRFKTWHNRGSFKYNRQLDILLDRAAETLGITPHRVTGMGAIQFQQRPDKTKETETETQEAETEESETDET